MSVSFHSNTQCSATCGKGTRMRYVSCRDEDGSVGDESACATLPKPVAKEECSVAPCGQWKALDWSSVSMDFMGLGRIGRWGRMRSWGVHIIWMGYISELDLRFKLACSVYMYLAKYKRNLSQLCKECTFKNMYISILSAQVPLLLGWLQISICRAPSVCSRLT